LTFCLAACSTEPIAPLVDAAADASASANDGGSSAEASSDAAPASDSATACADRKWTPVDRTARCLGTAILQPALCVPDPAIHKGIYDLCAVGPTHELFLGSVTQPVRVEEPGWTFAPVGTADILGIPAASAEDDAACGEFGKSLPACP
jgi:hypothetical protein